MSSKNTWVLLVIAAGMFALIFFFERPFRQKQAQGPDTKVFSNFKSSDVTAVQIQPAGQLDIRVEKTNQTWRLVRPLAFSAHRLRIESLLQVLEQLHWQAHISAEELKSRPNAHQEFGFDTPLFSVIVQDKNASRHFQIGSRTPVGGQLFLQVVGGSGYYLVDGAFLDFFPQNPNDWRDTAIVDLNKFSLDSLKIRSGGKAFELERGTNSPWRMTKPLEARANNSKIDALLKKLQTIQIAQFVTDNPKADLDLFGLQAPELELMFGRQTNLWLQIGTSPTNHPAYVFARQQNQPHIFLIPKEPLDAWRGTIDDFRDRHLINLAPAEIGQIEIRGDDTFVLQRQTNGVWTMNNSNSFSADSTFVNDLLVRLSRLEVEFEKAVVTDFASYGLAPPKFQYTLKTVSNNTNKLASEQIQFGTNEGGKFFVRRAEESSVNFIKPEDFQYLPRASWQFRDRRIWNFVSTNVASVTIRQKGGERKFFHKSENDWLILPESKPYTNAFSLEEAIYRLGDLKAIFWVARNENDRERFGFKEADHEISLQVKKEGRLEVLTLEFGGLSDLGHPYAATLINGERMIFEFPWDLYYQFVQQDLIVPRTK